MKYEPTYPSKFSNKKITAPNYLVELLFLKIAKREKKEFPRQFWNLPEYNKKYRLQLVHANKLLKKYNVGVIALAINDKRCYNLTSLGANYILEPIIKEYEKQHNKIKEELKHTESLEVSSEKPRKIFKKKSLKDEL